MGVEPMDRESIRELLLRFGLELDDVVVEEGVEQYKIDVPANRPDLLCVEAIAIALKVFQGGEHPNFTIVPPKLEMHVDKSVDGVRPLVICAVLRGVTFNDISYKSFIDLQEKLHQNLARRRTLASIGTHDLSKCKPPFKYLAQKPEDIKFIPLVGSEVEVDGIELFKCLDNHQQLSKYLYLIRDMPLWPVIRDSADTICSLPPIINSQATKITLDTHDIFIECTALDYTRALNAVICLCTAFSIYTSTPFTIEQVNVIRDGKAAASPVFDSTKFNVETSYIRTITGLKDLTNDQIIDLLDKMMIKAVAVNENSLEVTAPPIRSDVLHACDIAEDVAISYGYDNIFKKCRHHIQAGKPLQINEYTDRLRQEVSGCLWNEVLNFSLCSRNECYKNMRIEEDNLAVTVDNPKATEFEIVRTQILPGLLKVTRRILDQPNIKKALPLRLFEISDVIYVDETTENNARNERHFAATIADVKTRFEEIHGLLDRFFVLNGVPDENVKLVHEDTPTCIPGQRAAIMYKGNKVGWIGVIHPKVLQNFDLTTPVVGFEINIHPFVSRQ